MTVTENGKPPKITREWFRTRYGQSFPDLLPDTTNDFLDFGINDVYTTFDGVQTIWAHLDRKVYVEKTQLCFGLLVAWWITDIRPDLSLGVVSSGGIPIAMKSIGGTKIQFRDTASKGGAVNNADLLQSLKSNAYGAKAYMMIKTSGKLNTFITHG